MAVLRRACLVFVGLAVQGCTAIENDLKKGLAYGQSSEALARKADVKQPGRLPKGVNGYLWRAAIDTIGSLPLLTVDDRRGLILTDWHSAPSTPDERVQLKIEILAPDLRRDTLRVSVARQIMQNGRWVFAPAQPLVAQQLEDDILSKARYSQCTGLCP